MPYKPEGVAAYFDAFGEREWERLSASVQGRIKYAVHARFIRQFVASGMQVLDVGCGPGRFAIDLIRIGAEVTLADISAGQLALARARVEAEKLANQVAGFYEADVTKLDMFSDGQFDAVICFGAAISYTLERHTAAFRELSRVTRPEGLVLVSVASVFGTLRLLGPLDARSFLAAGDSHLDWHAVLEKENFVYTRPGSPEWHQPMVLMTSKGLRAALTDAGLDPLVIAAANPLLPESTKIPEIMDDPAAVEALHELEVSICDFPGLVDSGEHIIAVAKKPC